MSKHTPEPWESTLGCVTSIGNHVCSCVDPGRVSNARRIVTCVNACAGMTDPAAEIAELKRQRDELLDALNLARDYVGGLDSGGPALLGLICVIDDAIDLITGPTS